LEFQGAQSSARQLAGAALNAASAAVVGVSTYVPNVHVGVPWATVAQALPQEPQLARSLLTVTSHPFEASPSQLAVPTPHGLSPQTPAVQNGVPPWVVGQRLPQRPQAVTDCTMLASHPSRGSPLQSA